MAVFKNLTRLYSYAGAFFWYVMLIKKRNKTCMTFWGKHGDLLTMLSQKYNREFPLWYVLFHIITTTLDQWTRSIFSLLEL